MCDRTKLTALLLVAFTVSGCCGPADPAECDDPTPVYEVTSVAYQGHVVFENHLMLKEDFLPFLENVKQYYERFEGEIIGSPMYFEWRNIATMDEPFVVCDGGYWISCEASQESVGGLPRALWCIDRQGANES